MSEREFEYPKNEEPEKEKDPKVFNIVEYPDPILRQVAEPVSSEQFCGKGFKELKRIVDRMFVTVDHYEGIGLAAPQVGVSSQLFVTTVGPSADELQEALDAEEKRWEDEEIEIMDEGHKTALRADLWERLVAQNRRIFINPEIVEQEGESVERERCLSVPNISASVKRSLRIKVRALDLSGESFELEAEGLLAQCLQHEYDHVAPEGGKLIIDYMTSQEELLNDKKLKLLKRHYERQLRKQKVRKNLKRRAKRH